MADKRPALSILLPVFNGLPFLDAQLRSIGDQTVRDYELLVYDDGSTDNSAGLLRQVAADDARVKLFGSGTNDGQKFALRFLLAQAGAPLVMFSDQDDIWHPGKIERLQLALGDASLAYGSSHLIDAAGAELGRTIFDYNGLPVEGRDNTDFLFRSVASGHAMLVRREVVDPAIFTLGTEYDWLLAILATFSAGVVHVPDAITYHRQHSGNQVNAFGRPAASNARRQSKRWHRLMRMHDALALLRLSATLPAAKRSVFSRLFKALREDLMLSQPSLLHNHGFAAAFDSALAELQTPPAQAKRARQAVAKICRAALHPKSLRDVLAGG